MSLRVVFRPEARAELIEAWAWYEEQRSGLGDELATCVEAAVAAAARTPLAFGVVDEPIRRVLVRRFPYGVFYVLEGDAIVVLGIVHARRRPPAWKARP